jgi:hypothetical protein
MPLLAAFVQLSLQAGMQIRSALLGEATAQELSACVRRPEPRVLRNGEQFVGCQWKYSIPQATVANQHNCGGGRAPTSAYTYDA